MLGNSKVSLDLSQFLNNLLTFSENPGDINSYTFISDFCSNEEKENLEIFVRGQSSGFGLASFIFTDRPESTIFLHCELHACDPTEQSCETHCNTRKRRQVSENLVSIRVGPVKIKEYF